MFKFYFSLSGAEEITRNALTDQVSNRMGRGGDGGNGAAGGLAVLALLMKEPQSVTRLCFSCLRVFHGRRQEGERTAQALR